MAAGGGGSGSALTVWGERCYGGNWSRDGDRMALGCQAKTPLRILWARSTVEDLPRCRGGHDNMHL